MNKYLEVMLNKNINKHTGNLTWEVDDGMLIIIDDDNGEQVSCYNVGQWVYVRKVSG